MESVGRRIEDTRRMRLMTQADLAGKAKVSLITVTRLENNESPNPRMSTVKAIAEALEVDPAWLLFGVEDLKAAA
jgi:transcriptional regulator with XRE-family HTH domain